MSFPCGNANSWSATFRMLFFGWHCYLLPMSLEHPNNLPACAITSRDWEGVDQFPSFVSQLLDAFPISLAVFTFLLPYLVDVRPHSSTDVRDKESVFPSSHFLTSVCVDTFRCTKSRCLQTLASRNKRHNELRIDVAVRVHAEAQFNAPPHQSELN